MCTSCVFVSNLGFQEQQTRERWVLQYTRSNLGLVDFHNTPTYRCKYIYWGQLMYLHVFIVFVNVTEWSDVQPKLQDWHFAA